MGFFALVLALVKVLLCFQDNRCQTFDIGLCATQLEVSQHWEVKTLTVLFGGQAVLVIEVTVARTDDTKATFVIVMGCDKVTQWIGQDLNISIVNAISSFKVGWQECDKGFIYLEGFMIKFFNIDLATFNPVVEGSDIRLTKLWVLPLRLI